MRHLIVALALALGPLGPAVCEAACAHEVTAPMPAMPDCHMAAHHASAGDTGTSVTAAGDCRHPESRPALRTAGASTPDALTASAVLDIDRSATAFRHGRMIAARVAHSPPAPSAPRPLRI